MLPSLKYCFVYNIISICTITITFCSSQIRAIAEAAPRATSHVTVTSIAASEQPVEGLETTSVALSSHSRLTYPN